MRSKKHRGIYTGMERRIDKLRQWVNEWPRNKTKEVDWETLAYLIQELDDRPGPYSPRTEPDDRIALFRYFVTEERCPPHYSTVVYKVLEDLTRAERALEGGEKCQEP
jgi:hypothetical protein